MWSVKRDFLVTAGTSRLCAIFSMRELRWLYVLDRQYDEWCSVVRRTAKLKDSWTRQIFIVPLRHVPENFPQSSLFRRSNTTQVTGRPCLSIHFHTARLRINVDPISEQNACYNELSTHTTSITPTSLLFKCKAVEEQSKYWDLIWNFLPCNTSSNFLVFVKADSSSP